MKEKQARTSLTLGILSCIAWILPIVGYPICIMGIIFGIIGTRAVFSKGKAITGLVLSSVGLIATFINSFLGMLMQMQ